MCTTGRLAARESKIREQLRTRCFQEGTKGRNGRVIIMPVIGQGGAKNKKIYTYAEKMKVDEEAKKQTKTSLIYDYSSLCHHVPDENVKS